VTAVAILLAAAAIVWALLRFTASVERLVIEVASHSYAHRRIVEVLYEIKEKMNGGK
jgi:hypothetical protein